MKRFLPILVLAYTLSSCNGKTETVSPTTGNITESVYASGIIKCKNQYQVHATVNGLVQKILIREGDMVKKGGPLLIIQSENSRLSAENAKLLAEFARNNAQGERLAEAKSAIDLARTRMVNDSLLLVRQRTLWAQKIGSQIELEQRELAYASSVNYLQSTLLRYQDLKKQLEFSAKQSEKQWSISRNLESDYVIRAQKDGRVYSINIEAGELVSPQTPVAIMGDATAFEAELQVDENDIARIKPGQRVLLTLDSYKDQVFEAALAWIEPIMNERTRTFTVKADFTRQPPLLYPNLSTEANILISTREAVLLIPRNYLMGDSLVLLENRETRKVQIGLKDYQKAEILGGINAGEKICKPDQ